MGSPAATPSCRTMCGYGVSRRARPSCRCITRRATPRSTSARRRSRSAPAREGRLLLPDPAPFQCLVREGLSTGDDRGLPGRPCQCLRVPRRGSAIPPELDDSTFVPLARPDQIDDILCLHAERTVARDSTVRYGRRILQIPAGPGRPHYVKVRVRVHEYPDGYRASVLSLGSSRGSFTPSSSYPYRWRILPFRCSGRLSSL